MAPPGEVFGKMMSIPDRLLEPYFRSITEWRKSEIDVALNRVVSGSVHPMDLKKILAGEATAAIHGVDAAMKARSEFVARFSRRQFAEIDDMPLITDPHAPIADIIRGLGFAKSNSEIRRAAEQNGLRLVAESAEGQSEVTLNVEELRHPLSQVFHDKFPNVDEGRYLKLGRKIARLSGKA